jgi:hypothetical protein
VDNFIPPLLDTFRPPLTPRDSSLSARPYENSSYSYQSGDQEEVDGVKLAHNPKSWISGLHKRYYIK